MEKKFKTRGSFYLSDEDCNFINENLHLLPDFNHNDSINKIFVDTFTNLIRFKKHNEEIEALRIQNQELKKTIEDYTQDDQFNQLAIDERDELIEQLKQEIETLKNQAPEVQEKEVEVIKEVEKQLAPYQVLIQFSEIQYKLLQKINQNRHEKGREKEVISIEELIKKHFFSKNFLYNYSGEFPTYLPELPENL